MNVVDFLKEYWSFIGIGLVVILFIILLIIKRKPLTKIVDESLIAKIIEFVCSAETLFGAKSGVTKLSYVLGKIREIRPTDFEEYESIYTDIVEYVLSLPHKKE